jgi:hypothetical protein
MDLQGRAIANRLERSNNPAGIFLLLRDFQASKASNAGGIAWRSERFWSVRLCIFSYS